MATATLTNIRTGREFFDMEDAKIIADMWNRELGRIEWVVG